MTKGSVVLPCRTAKQALRREEAAFSSASI
jgi:hypothetical protein